MICTLIGSTRFQKEFAELERDLTLSGHIVLGLGVYGGRDLPEYDWSRDVLDYIPKLTAIAYNKIMMAQVVWVVDVNGYVGQATESQIAFAESQDKIVRYLSNSFHSKPLLDTRIHRKTDPKNEFTICGRKDNDRVVVLENALYKPDDVKCVRCFDEGDSTTHLFADSSRIDTVCGKDAMTCVVSSAIENVTCASCKNLD